VQRLQIRQGGGCGGDPDDEEDVCMRVGDDEGAMWWWSRRKAIIDVGCSLGGGGEGCADRAWCGVLWAWLASWSHRRVT
jgi:hypothetical protein